MKILLTGNAGFIGKHLQKELEDLGNIVEGYDIRNNFIEDIRNESYLDKVFNQFKPEAVIHLAARAGVRESVEAPHEYISTNIDGSYNILKMSKKYEVERVLVASSSSVYGIQPSIAMKEDLHSCEIQQSIYGMTKKAVETLCQMFPSSKTKVFVFRPFTVYGENGRPEMVVGKLINCIQNREPFPKYGDGKSIRGYTNVHDLVDGIVKLLYYKTKDNFDIFNLGGSEKISLNNLIDIAKSIYPNLTVDEQERNEFDVLTSFADTSKAKKLLKWEPTRSFKDEIIKLLKQ